MTMCALSRRPAAALVILALAAGCGGGGDDGDGGQLSAREEQQVKEWFTEINELAQALDGMADPFSSDQSQMEEALSQLRTIAGLTPPRLSDDEADQAFQDLHGGMALMINAMIEMFENMPSPDQGPAAMASVMEAMAGMEQTMLQAEQQVRGAEQTLRTIIEVDFGDDPEVQALLQEAMGNLDI
jgi:hypothetical protein